MNEHNQPENPILNDIKDHQSNHNLDLASLLKAQELKDNPISNSDTNNSIDRQLNLRNIQKSSKIFTKKNNSLADITTTQKQNFQRHFQTNFSNNPQSKVINLKEIIRLACAGFVIIFLLNVISAFSATNHTSNQLKKQANNGFIKLIEAKSAIQDFNIISAQKSLLEAQQSFQTASDEIWFLKDSLTSQNFANNSQTSTMANLIASGESITKAGQELFVAADDINQLYNNFVTSNQQISTPTPLITPISSNNKPIIKPSITEDIRQRFSHLKLAINHLQRAQNNLENIVPNQLPLSYRERFQLAKDTLNNLVTKFDQVHRQLPVLMKLLGDRHPHRYLVLLQNNSEARPTGGFIGSYLIVDINDGYLTKLDFHDVYDADGQLHEAIPAPEEIAELTDNWALRDSNYSPDFKISALKAAWFLEKEKGPGVDTIIAVNQDILQSILQITGPIQLDGFEASIDANNYQNIISFLVESKWAGSETPKDVLKNLLPQIQAKITTAEAIPQLIPELIKQANQKNILVYSKDETLQEFFENFNVAGALTPVKSKDDYLMVNNISIAGNKSDRFIQQKLHHRTYFEANGEIINELTIKRSHFFSPEIEQQIRNDLAAFKINEIPNGVMDILGKGPNRSAMKVYVPKGATLLSVDGINTEEIQTKYNDQLAKTYFYFFMNVQPQNTQTVTLRYKLPFKADWSPSSSYKLIVDKQPGTLNTVDFEKQIIDLAELTEYQIYPEGWETQGNKIIHRTNLLYNQVFAGVWGH